jgi:predicted PurR-regulated permease PerM
METKRQWSDTLRYMAVTGIIILSIILFSFARSNLNLILIAGLIAYILSPLVRFQVRILRFKKSLAVIFSYLILIILVVLLSSLVIPLITSKFQVFLSTDWPMVIQSIDTWLGDIILELEVKQLKIGSVGIDLTVPLVELRKTINSFDISKINVSSIIPDLSRMLQSVISVSANVLSTAFHVSIAILTTIMASFHFSNDGWKIKDWIANQFVESYRAEVRELINRLGGVWNNYFVGELKLMISIGIITFLVCTGLGLKWALWLGIIAGFCEVVPNIGPIISSFPAILSAMIFGSEWIPLNNFLMVLVVIAAYLLIQQMENILITPRVMSEALNIHPVIITLGILILSSRLGLFGALLAAPIIGIAKEILNFMMCKIRKEDPYPELSHIPELDFETLKNHAKK